MPIQDNDMFLIQRNTDKYKCTAQDIADFTNNGFTGDVVVDGVTLTFTDGLLTNVQ